MDTARTIGTVARELSIDPKSIRYYEEIGLIPRARRTAAGFHLPRVGARLFPIVERFARTPSAGRYCISPA